MTTEIVCSRDRCRRSIQLRRPVPVGDPCAAGGRLPDDGRERARRCLRIAGQQGRAARQGARQRDCGFDLRALACRGLLLSDGLRRLGVRRSRARIGVEAAGNDCRRDVDRPLPSLSHVSFTSGPSFGPLSTLVRIALTFSMGSSHKLKATCLL
jgi:hypothetical protein